MNLDINIFDYISQEEVQDSIQWQFLTILSYFRKENERSCWWIQTR